MIRRKRERPRRLAIWKQIADAKIAEQTCEEKDPAAISDSHFAARYRRTIPKRAWANSQSSSGKLRRKRGIRPIAKVWKDRPAVKVFRDKREQCNPETDEGRAEYAWMRLLMWVRQDGWCCFRRYDFCPGELKLKAATFQHEALRGKDRDDRVWDGKKAINGAAHGLCNMIAGSRRMEIDHGTNLVLDVRDL